MVNLAKGLIRAESQRLEDYATDVLERLARHALKNDSSLTAFEGNMGWNVFRSGRVAVDESLLKEDAQAVIMFADWCQEHFGHQISVFVVR